jgi:hypothetical protein
MSSPRHTIRRTFPSMPMPVMERKPSKGSGQDASYSMERWLQEHPKLEAWHGLDRHEPKRHETATAGKGAIGRSA